MAWRQHGISVSVEASNNGMKYLAINNNSNNNISVTKAMKYQYE